MVVVVVSRAEFQMIPRSLETPAAQVPCPPPTPPLPQNKHWVSEEILKYVCLLMGFVLK